MCWLSIIEVPSASDKVNSSFSASDRVIPCCSSSFHRQITGKHFQDGRSRLSRSYSSLFDIHGTESTSSSHRWFTCGCDHWSLDWWISNRICCCCLEKSGDGSGSLVPDLRHTWLDIGPGNERTVRFRNWKKSSRRYSYDQLSRRTIIHSSDRSNQNAGLITTRKER